MSQDYTVIQSLNPGLILFRWNSLINLTCLFLVSGKESIQKAFHCQQRGDPYSCAYWCRLTQIQDHSGQREVGAWKQRDRLVNQVLSCERDGYELLRHGLGL